MTRTSPLLSLRFGLPHLLTGLALAACTQTDPKRQDNVDGGSALGGAGLGGASADGGSNSGGSPNGSGSASSGGTLGSGGKTNGTGGKSGSGGTGGGSSSCADGSVDTDTDGVPDSCDVDIDNDGLIEISSLTQLDWIRNSLGGYERHNGTSGDKTGCPPVEDGACHGYELTNNVDFDTNGDGKLNSSDDFYDPDADGSNKGFAPIENFFGTFDGNGHSIKNLYINRPAENSVGFFSVLRDSVGKGVVVRNVKFDGVLTRVVGRNTVGIAIGNVLTLNSKLQSGLLFASEIRNVSTFGNVECAGSADTDAAGGVIGAITATNYLSDPGSIVDLQGLSFDGAVSGADQGGGIIGRIATSKGASVSASELLSNSDVYVVAVSGNRMAGGIVGSAATDTYGTSSGGIDLYDVAAFGSVNTTACGGGIVGYANTGAGSVGVTRAIAVAKVKSTSTAGGVLGCKGSDGGGTFATGQAYILGAVTGAGSVTGSFLGYFAGGSVAASDVYYSISETGEATDVPFFDDPNIVATSIATLQCAPSTDVACTDGTTVLKNFDDKWNFGSSSELPGLTINGALVRPVKSGDNYVVAP